MINSFSSVIIYKVSKGMMTSVLQSVQILNCIIHIEKRYCNRSLNYFLLISIVQQTLLYWMQDIPFKILSLTQSVVLSAL